LSFKVWIKIEIQENQSEIQNISSFKNIKYHIKKKKKKRINEQIPKDS
jgi:hypothetical protein